MRVRGGIEKRAAQSFFAGNSITRSMASMVKVGHLTAAPSN
jgi:hypothetical protein